jgi:hypothetical protein
MRPTSLFDSTHYKDKVALHATVSLRSAYANVDEFRLAQTMQGDTIDIVPRKKRDIRNAYRVAGFKERQPRGDHTIFTHPLVHENYAAAGNNGHDAYPYDEQNLKRALNAKHDAERRQKP